MRSTASEVVSTFATTSTWPRVSGPSDELRPIAPNRGDQAFFTRLIDTLKGAAVDVQDTEYLAVRSAASGRVCGLSHTDASQGQRPGDARCLTPIRRRSRAAACPLAGAGDWLGEFRRRTDGGRGFPDVLRLLSQSPPDDGASLRQL